MAQQFVVGFASMLRRVEPPGATENPELTQGVYQGLEALIDYYQARKAVHEEGFWRMLTDKLRRVPVADWHLAQAIADGLEDHLAWHYDAKGWREEADGWRKVGAVVRRRADDRNPLRYRQYYG